MGFKITIVETRTYTQMGKKGNWAIIGQRPVTMEELCKAGYDKETEQLRTAAAEGKILINEYGYTPPRDEEVTVDIKMYEQYVEVIDITKVIGAVNSPLSPPMIYDPSLFDLKDGQLIAKKK